MEDKDVAMGEVTAFLHDRDGFMWLGGRNAVFRYDGYDLKQLEILEDPSDPSKNRAVNMVSDIIQTRDGDIWVASKMGLLKYDPANEILLRLKPEVGEAKETYYSFASHIAEIDTGEILVAAYNGLVIVDPNTYNVTRLNHNPSDPASIAHNTINDIYVDKDQRIWLATAAGISLFNRKNKSFTNYIPHEENPNDKTRNNIHAVDQDHLGDFWLASDSGVYRFNENSFELFSHDPSAPNKPSTPPGNHIVDVFVDSQGWVWLATNSGGIAIYNHTSGRFMRYQAGSQPGDLKVNSFRRVYEDNNGDIWVGGMPSGAYFHDRSSTAIRLYTQNSNHWEASIVSNGVTSILEDKDANLWIGAGGGISFYNRKAGTFKHYHQNQAKPNLMAGGVLAGEIDSDGDIWFGTWSMGIHKYNSETDRFDPIPFDATLKGSPGRVTQVMKDQVAWSIYEDSQHRLWVGNFHAGLALYDKQKREFTTYHPNDGGTEALSNGLVWTTLEDSKGNFWVGTASTLSLMDRAAGTFKHHTVDPSNPRSLANSSVLSLHEDSNGRLWVGTDAGLHLYDPNTDDFTVYTTKDGFIDHGIRAITSDHEGYLWLGTNNGIIRFHPETQKINNYKSLNGYPVGGISTGAVLRTQRGEIIFGGEAGMYIIDIQKLGVNAVPPPVVLTDFKLFTESVPVATDSNALLNKVINQTQRITLDHTKTMFSFHFSALNFRSPEKNQYAYKLEGFDDTWREVGTERKALYTNISAGNYIFRVRASNNDGIWNNEGKAITLIKLPPPWKTWWAFSLYCLAIFCMLALFVHRQRYKRKIVEEQNRILEQRVTDRTTDLAAKVRDIHDMLGNIRQGLFTILPDGKIHHEYSRFLESIFGAKNLAGTDAFELMFEHAHIGSDLLNQTKEGVLSIIGEDVVSFDLNAHLLLTEYTRSTDNVTKHLTLDWRPIVNNDDVVEKLMVSVQDVTELKKLEGEAKNKTRELDIIGQLINVPAKSFLTFTTLTEEFLAENRKIIHDNPTRNPEALALLFRNMHTIKGNCRTYDFLQLSDLVHDVESVYSDMMKSNDIPWDVEVLLNDMDAVAHGLQRYVDIYNNVLGRDNKAQGRNNVGFWLNEEDINRIKECIEDAQLQAPAIQQNQNLSSILKIMDIGLSTPFSDALRDIVKSLDSIASQLNKAPPVVNIEDYDIRVTDLGQRLIKKVFAHLLRNCMDHGLETIAERQNKGKAPEGRIDIRLEKRQKHVRIQISDDGRGLNIHHLFDKGVEQKLWAADASISHSTIAALIFNSTVSTKKEVDSISGRGVGMDAVKHFLIDHQGEIDIELQTAAETYQKTDGELFAPFLLALKIPSTFFVLVER